MISQEITDGVKKSGQAVQAAGAGIQQIGSMARQQTMCMFTPSNLCSRLTVGLYSNPIMKCYSFLEQQ